MPNLTLIFIIGSGLILFSVFSARLQRSIITPPLFFALMGFLLGPYVLHLGDFEIEHNFIQILAEITLVFILFTDAARIDLRQLYKEHDLPICLLLIGLPLTIILGMIIGKYIFAGYFSLLACAILSTILAPTDAALGQAVVSNSRLPIRIRQALNIESGLNDGIVLPVILILIATGTETSVGQWSVFIVLQILLSPILGIAIGALGGKLLKFAAKKQWITHNFQDLVVITLALMAYVISELLGANGFIAAFCAGLAIGNLTRDLCECLYEFTESEGQLLSLLIFLIFGAVLLPLAIQNFTWTMLFYALMSLTIIRMVPVFLCLSFSHLRWQSKLFLGWFGPRGLASILFGLLVLERSNLPMKTELMEVVILTVAISIFAHGVTAFYLSQAYANFMESIKLRKPSEEKPVSSMPLKVGNDHRK